MTFWFTLCSLWLRALPKTNAFTATNRWSQSKIDQSVRRPKKSRPMHSKDLDFFKKNKDGHKECIRDHRGNSCKSEICRTDAPYAFYCDILQRHSSSGKRNSENDSSDTMSPAVKKHPSSQRTMANYGYASAPSLSPSGFPRRMADLARQARSLSSTGSLSSKILSWWLVSPCAGRSGTRAPLMLKNLLKSKILS